MKKLVVIAILAVGTSSFASSGKVVKHFKVKKATVSCCSVGEFTNCGYDGVENCHKSRVQYCNAHPCSKATLATL